MRAGDEAQEGESEDSTTAEDDALMGGDAAAAARGRGPTEGAGERRIP